jgi:hypothetical protein
MEIPDGVAQVGCTTPAVVGTIEWSGTALIVIADDEGNTRISAVFLTYNVYLEPILKKHSKIYVVPSKLYSTPIVSWWEILPDGVAQFGCTTPVVGAKWRKWEPH